MSVALLQKIVARQVDFHFADSHDDRSSNKVFQDWASAANISILCAIPARSTPRIDADGYARLKPERCNHPN